MSDKTVSQRQKHFPPLPALLSLLFFALGNFSHGSETINPGAIARAEKVFHAAQERLTAEPTNAEAAWQFSRACFDLADVVTNSTERASIATQGISAAQQLLRREPKSAAGHYYLALNVGQLAQTKSLGALKLVDEMEKELSAAIELDEKFDFAGADRSVGLLYRDAPGWPMSLGNRSKARQHLLRARQLAPDYPENQLNLVETFIKWQDDDALHREAKKFEEMLPDARKKFTGEQWETSWNDWNRRWHTALQKMNAKPQFHSPSRTQ